MVGEAYSISADKSSYSLKEPLVKGKYERYFNFFFSYFLLVIPVTLVFILVGYFQPPFIAEMSISLLLLAVVDLYYIVLVVVLASNSRHKIIHLLVLLNSVIIIPYLWMYNFGLFTSWSIPSTIIQLGSFITIVIANKKKISSPIRTALLIIPLVIILHIIIFIGIGFYAMGEVLKQR